MAWLDSLTLVDYGIVVILLVSAISGWARGILGVFTGLVSFVIGLIIASSYHQTVLAWLESRWSLVSRFADFLAERFGHAVGAATGSQPAWQHLFETVGPTLEGAQFYGWANTILGLAVFAVMVLLITGLLSSVGHSLSSILSEVPLMGTVNRLLGAIASVLVTGVVLALLLVVAVPALEIFGMADLAVALSDAALTPYLMGWLNWISTELSIFSPRQLPKEAASGTYF